MRLLQYLFVGAAFAASSPSLAQQAEDTAAKLFGARVSVRDASFSPSGNRLAIVAPYEQSGQMVRVYELGEQPSQTTIIYNNRPDMTLLWCDWASEEQLVCQMRATDRSGPTTLLPYTRLLAYSMKDHQGDLLSASSDSHSARANQDGGDLVAWSVAGKGPGTILVSRDFVPEIYKGSHLGRKADGLGVELLDLATKDREVVERARPDAMRYLADENGKVRLAEIQPSDQNGYLKEQSHYLFRPVEGGTWDTWKLGADAPKDFVPLSVDSALNVAYGLADKDGYDALYTVSLDATARGNVVVSHPGADIDALIRIGNGGRVVGASYATDRRQVDFFDPQLKSLTAALEKALAGHPHVEIVDASADEQRLLLEASSDTVPGMLYSFDKATKKLEELLPLRPELKDIAMGTMQSISYPAADGTPIPAYLTLPPGSGGKNLPAIVLPHGGPSSRDEWGFDWLVQYFVHRGYAVLQPNYRGSAGYGSDWFRENGFKSWPVAIGDVDDAGRWLVSQGIADPAKLAIVGWSYGGYAALQSQVVDPDLYKAVVAIAPVTDLDRLREESRNFTNFEIVDAFIGRGAHVEGGSPARHAAAFKAPVLLFHGDLDQNVGVDESRLMEKRLQDAGKSVRYVEFAGLDHQIDDATQRPRMLQEIGSFLEASLTR